MPTTQSPAPEGFEIGELLSSGPTARVLRARQLAVKRSVWLKCLGAEILPSSPIAEALRQEASILAALNHPNIQTLFDCLDPSGSLILVLEDLQGCCLEQLLTKGAQSLTPDASVAIALQLSRALWHCAQAGVVHGALCPAHVWLTLDGQVKLLGFDSARRQHAAPSGSQGQTASAEPRWELNGPLPDGNAQDYLSPEQILGEACVAASDQFALGVLLYQMLSGTHPFAPAEGGSLAQRIRHARPKPLSTAGGRLPASLDRIVQRCLEKFPADRFFSAKDLAIALAGELSHTERPASALVAAQLERSGVGSRPSEAPPSSRAPGRLRQRPLLLRGAWFFGACFVTAVAGFATIETLTHRAQEVQPLSRGPLPLVPDNPGKLRVLASPWAHVLVDGTHVETTPFAQPIPLAPGRHDIRLQHPSAPEERRLVSIAAGETVLLDVKLRVASPQPDPAGLEHLAPDAGAPSP